MSSPIPVIHVPEMPEMPSQMESNKFIKYGVYTILTGIVIFLAYHVFTFQFRVFEGMTQSNKKSSKSASDVLDDKNDTDIITIAKNQKEKAETIQSSLNIDQNYPHYTAIIDNMDGWVNAKIVTALKNVSYKIHNDGKMEDIIQHMNELNTMKKFRTTLNDCAKYIDSN